MPLEGGVADASMESKQRKRRFSEEVPPSGNSMKKSKVGVVLQNKPEAKGGWRAQWVLPHGGLVWDCLFHWAASPLLGSLVQ